MTREPVVPRKARSRSVIETETDVPPDVRFEMTGSFDPLSYNDDLERYPDLFDSNGWPQFGSYDPYSLSHPITEAAWYECPRIATSSEDDVEYESWFYLATMFETIETELFVELRKLNKARSEAAVSKVTTSDFVSSRDSKEKNTHVNDYTYLRRHVLPGLRECFRTRTGGPEFAVLWGEYCSIANGIFPQIEKRMRGHIGRVKGAEGHSKDPQLKWYLHFRRHYASQNGWTTNKIIREFLQLALDVASGRRAPPEGFSTNWFALSLERQPARNGSAAKPMRGLANSLKRGTRGKRAELLLASAPDKFPCIPPIILEAYPDLEK